MAKYMFLFRGGAFVTEGLSPTVLQGHLQKWTEWVGRLVEAQHHLPGGQVLHRDGKVLKGKDREVTDGPYAESKDLVTGNLYVEAPSLEKATELAQGCPIFEYDGSVEVRAVLEHGS